MVELRPIVDSEQPDLWAAAQRYWLELMPNAPTIKDPQQRATYFRRHFLLDAAHSVYWWAVVGGQNVGFARVDVHEDADHDGPWAAIRDFFIEPAQRRRGYGRAFAQAIVARLQEQGIRQIDLHVRADNPRALAFWKSCGFDLALYRLRRYL